MADELCRVADRLETWKAEFDWDDEHMAFEIERDVMVSAYAIRKLLEACKLADSFTQSRILVTAYPLIDRTPDRMNWHRVDEFYDFERKGMRELKLSQLCNQFIHSFIWIPECDDRRAEGGRQPAGLAGIFVASDRERESHLLRIEVDTLIDLLRSVGTEDVVFTQSSRGASGEWQVSNRSAADLDHDEPAWRASANRQRGE